MAVASGQQIIYDNGFNNTAVRPTADDIGRGGNSPFINPLTGLPFPLSFSALAELQAVGNLPFDPILFPFAAATPILPCSSPNFPVANDGNFKVPGLRNVELTAPYFHDGGVMTLEDVVDFYTRGGNFPGGQPGQPRRRHCRNRHPAECPGQAGRPGRLHEVDDR